MKYAQKCVAEDMKPDMGLMMEWIRNPPASLKDATL
jgi:hypothetical protein